MTKFMLNPSIGSSSELKYKNSTSFLPSIFPIFQFLPSFLSFLFFPKNSASRISNGRYANLVLIHKILLVNAQLSVVWFAIIIIERGACIRSLFRLCTRCKRVHTFFHSLLFPSFFLSFFFLLIFFHVPPLPPFCFPLARGGFLKLFSYE